MFPYYQVTKDDFKLPYDDTVGIQQLYGAKNPSKWAPMPPLPTDAPSVPGEHPRVTERPRDPTSPSFTPDETPDHIPKTCETNFDAISSIRREIFLFKGKVRVDSTKGERDTKNLLELHELRREWLDFKFTSLFSFLSPALVFLATERQQKSGASLSYRNQSFLV